MRSAVPTSRPPLRFGAGLSRHFITVDPLMPSDWWAFIFPFVVAGSTLVATNINGTDGILTFLASSGLLVLLFPSVAVQSIARNWPLLLYPAWTILSIAWSTEPERTAHSVALVVPTVLVALTLGGIPKRREVNLGAAAAMFALIAASLRAGGHVGFSDTGSGGDALTGFGSGKNYFGHLAAMSAVLSFSFFSFTDTRFGRLLVMVGLADLAISLFALLGAHATGSLLAFVIACAVIGVVVTFTRVPWQIRVLSLATLLGVVVIYVTFGDTLQTMLYDTVLQKFNKDSSLTGRTMLWDYADRLMLSHRMLGYGFNAFWYWTNPDAWAIWRMMGVAPMSGFNFHNTPREILIESGLVGFGIYLAGFGFMFVRAFFTNLLRGDLASAVRLGFICYFVVRMPVESTGFAGATADAILLMTFLCLPVKENVSAPATTRASVGRSPRFVRAPA